MQAAVQSARLGQDWQLDKWRAVRKTRWAVCRAQSTPQPAQHRSLGSWYRGRYSSCAPFFVARLCLMEWG